MKKIISSVMLFVAFNGFAQLVQGEINIKEQSKIELTAKSNKAVNLFADFRENKYPIHFAFTASDVPLNSDKKRSCSICIFNYSKKRRKNNWNHQAKSNAFFSRRYVHANRNIRCNFCFIQHSNQYA